MRDPDYIATEDMTPEQLAEVNATVGRPRIELDKGRLEAAASTFAGYEELAALFGVSDDFLSMNYKKTIANGRAKGKLTIRRRMYEKSKTSDRVLIHLYDRHVEPKPEKDQTIVVVGDSTKPLVIREAVET